MAEETTTPVVLASLFKSYAPSIKYVFKDGSVANFMNHRYFTSNSREVAELKYEIEQMKHPAFYIDPRETKVNPTEQDPMSRLRKMIIEQYLSDLNNKTGPDNDMGETKEERLTPASTTDIAAVTANGDARSIQAKLAQLIPPTPGK